MHGKTEEGYLEEIYNSPKTAGPGAASHNNMRLIVTIGWARYPIGDYLLGEVDEVYLEEFFYLRGDTLHNSVRSIVIDDWAAYSADYFFGHWFGEIDDMYLEVIFNFAKDCSAEVHRLSTTSWD